MKQRELIKKLEAAGFIEQIPRHKEINEMLAKAILRKWGL